MSVTWIYGPPCSGKSSLLEKFEGVKLDSHSIRELSGNWALTPEDRTNNVLNLAAVAKTLSDQGLNVAVAAITPKRAQRVHVQSIIPDVEFIMADHDLENLSQRQAERFGTSYKDEGFEYNLDNKYL